MRVTADNGSPREQLSQLADQFVEVLAGTALGHVILTRLTERLLEKASGAGSTSFNDGGPDDEEERGRGSRRAGRKKRKRGPNLTSESILALLKEKGPQRVAQLKEITGLTQTTLHKKIKELKASGAVKRVSGEGRIVMWKAARDGRSRVTKARSGTSKKKKRVKKETTATAAAT